jgi:polyisoprenoid-binding protein YceI
MPSMKRGSSSPRRRFLCLGAATLALAILAEPGEAAEPLTIGSARGNIDFSIGDNKIFRTTGSFKEWSGHLVVDDVNVANSRVDVTVRTGSVTMLDTQQTGMMREAGFFDVERFPEMVFQSQKVERTGESTLKVFGTVLLRGVTRPMQLDVSVTDLKPNATPGSRYARFRATGTIKRSEFGMTKFIDIVGDAVDITIRAEAWR